MKQTAQAIILTGLLFSLHSMMGDAGMMEMPASLDMPPMMDMGADLNTSMKMPDMAPPPMPIDDDDEVADIPATSPSPASMPTMPPVSTVAAMPTMPAPTTTPAATTPLEAVPTENDNNQDIDEEEAALIDTVDYPEEKIGIQGNWQRKKNWLTQALDLYQNEIEQLITKIYTVRNQFNTKYNTIDQTFDSFYKEIGIEQGKLQELFRNIERYLDKKKQKDLENLLKEKESFELTERNYSMKADDVETHIKDLRASLDQLRLDMKSIEDIDASVSERLKKLDREIDIALQEGDQAREIINEMWYVIDDRKARALYYNLKGKSLEKLKAIDRYLSTDLLNDFNSVITTAQNQINKVKKEADRLEKEGIIIKQRTSRTKKLKQEKTQKILEKEKEDDAEFIKIKKPPKKTKAPTTQSWYTKLLNFFTYFTKQLTTVVSNFFASSEDAQTPTKKTTDSPPAPIQTTS